MRKILDLTFLTQDVTRQQELARQALEEAKRLDELMKTMDEDEKSRLGETKRKWLEMSKALSDNIVKTCGTASIALGL